MGWHAPKNWTEVLTSVRARYDFNARSLRIQGAETSSVCGHYGTRALLSGHLDDFALSIIESHDAINHRYMNGHNRDTVVLPESFIYVVTRDGNAIVAVTRSGDVMVNPAVDQTTRRYREVVDRVVPVLEEVAKTWIWVA